MLLYLQKTGRRKKHRGTVRKVRKESRKTKRKNKEEWIQENFRADGYASAPEDFLYPNTGKTREGGCFMDRITERILSKAGLPDLSAKAGAWHTSDFNSVLLQLFRVRAGGISPQKVLQNFKENRFVRPGETDPIVLGQLKLDLMKLAAEFEMGNKLPCRSWFLTFLLSLTMRKIAIIVD